MSKNKSTKKKVSKKKITQAPVLDPLDEAKERLVKVYGNSFEVMKEIKAIKKHLKISNTDCKFLLKIIEKEEQEKNEISSDSNSNKWSDLEKQEFIKKMIGGDYLTCQDNDFNYLFNLDTKTAQYYFALRLMKENKFLPIDESNELLKYDEKEGTYSDGYGFVKRECKIRLGVHATIHIQKEIIDTINDEKESITVLNNNPKNLIPLGNGLFNITTGLLQVFDSKYIFKTKIPIRYNKKATCPKFKEFLVEVLVKNSKHNNLSDNDKLKVNCLQESMGYCMLYDTRFQKAVLYYGFGANGKSVLIKILNKLLGSNNVTKIPLQYLEENNFAAARLYGKLANIFADLPDKALKVTSKFKSCVAGDPITAERKGIDSFEFNPFATQVFSCNSVPNSPDNSIGFYRRWLIFIFPNEFKEGSETTNTNLEDELSEELEGILIYALEGLSRLIRNDSFSPHMNILEVEDFWVKHSDSVLAFIKDMVVKQPTATIKKTEVFDMYEEYCSIKGYTSEFDSEFYKRLKQKITIDERKPKGMPRYFLGIELKNIESLRGESNE